MKDNFSARSNLYAQFRPVYPQTLYDFLLPLVKTKQTAWDCGTGNGQVARELVKQFQVVYATDISRTQIANAEQRDNIIYKVESAEHSNFPDQSFDLITVAQAIHWFDFGAFYKEVNRVAKPGAILAVVGYGLFTIDNEIDKVIAHFYENITGPYWDKERKYLDERYLTIPFPFKEIKVPQIFIETQLNFDQLIGFLNTWSAVQHYIKANNLNPVDLIYDDMKSAWKNDQQKNVKFPVFLRVAKIK